MSLAIVGMIAEVVFRMARKAKIQNDEGMYSRNYNLQKKPFLGFYLCSYFTKNFGRFYLGQISKTWLKHTQSNFTHNNNWTRTTAVGGLTAEIKWPCLSYHTFLGPKLKSVM